MRVATPSDLVGRPWARVNCHRLSIPVLAALLAAWATLFVLAYIAWLSLPASPRACAEPGAPLDVLVVVPVFDEAPFIIGKLNNLSGLRYRHRQVVIVDGGSTDGSEEQAASWIASHPGFELLRTSHRNKTAQINSALENYPDATWILVTDADAVLQPDALERLTAVISADPQVGVAGASVRPREAHTLESLHWRFAEWLRGRERQRGSASIVTAPCYLVRRELIENLPADTVADDVHVSCRAMAAGQRIEVAATTVVELRSPRSLRMLLRHKHRKADAYLREVFRFLPYVGHMPSPMRGIFLWRAALMTVVPLVAVAGVVLLTTSLAGKVFQSVGEVELWALGIGAFGLATRPARQLLRFACLAGILAGVSASALVCYPFSRQTASFPKVLRPSECRFAREPE